MEYNNDNTGVLFLNDKKSEKAPDYTGTYNHDRRNRKTWRDRNKRKILITWVQEC